MTENQVTKNITHFDLLQNGFRTHNIEDIENGLIKSYEEFIEFILENRRDDLVNLGRNLSAVYFPNKLEMKSPQNIENISFGELKALVSLCDYVTQLRVPEQIWRKIGKSKYTEPILNSLLKNGPMLATDLSKSINLPHDSQLSRIVRPLILEKVVTLEELGKNTWYSLTATGRLIANKRFGGEEFQNIEKVIPLIISKIKGDWCSVNQLVDLISPDITGSSRYIFVNILLLALKEAGIIEEKNAKWKISYTSTYEKSIYSEAINKLNEIKAKQVNEVTINKLLEISTLFTSSDFENNEAYFVGTFSKIMSGVLHEIVNKDEETEKRLDDACHKCYFQTFLDRRISDSSLDLEYDNELLNIERKSEDAFAQIDKNSLFRPIYVDWVNDQNRSKLMPRLLETRQ
jgi:hypothetical protein